MNARAKYHYMQDCNDSKELWFDESHFEISINIKIFKFKMWVKVGMLERVFKRYGSSDLLKKQSVFPISHRPFFEEQQF